MKNLIFGAVLALFTLTSFANNEIPNENLLPIDNIEISTIINVDNNVVDNINILDIIITMDIQIDSVEGEDLLSWCVRLALAVTGYMQDAGYSGAQQLAVANEIGSWC